MDRKNRYVQIIERLFLSSHHAGQSKVDFSRSRIEEVASELGIRLPKNLGDLIYTFRYRGSLPPTITATAPKGREWVIAPAGRGRYRFELVPIFRIAPQEALAETKIPDSTPGIIIKYAFSDEQALLAKLRYNRLIDIFTSVTCYSLQSHLRTTVAQLGQVETDEVYIGVDKRGAHYVFPVQAKGGRDKVGVVQVIQDFALCREKFPALICRPIAAQFMRGDVIALFELVETPRGLGISAERHYRLVPPEEVSEADLQAYQQLTGE